MNYKYLELKYKLYGGGVFQINGGQLYIMMNINDSIIAEKLNELKENILNNDDNKHEEFHITLFDVNFNVQNKNYFKKIIKIIKDAKFIKYVNDLFKVFYNNITLELKDHHKMLGKIWENNYDGRFITLHFNYIKNNEQKIKHFRTNILTYILKECKLEYKENHFYPNIRDKNNNERKNDKGGSINDYWIYSYTNPKYFFNKLKKYNKDINKYKDKKAIFKKNWIEEYIIFSIKSHAFPFNKWTPHISIISFQELIKNKIEYKSSFINKIDREIRNISNILFNKINMEIFVSIREKKNDKFKHIIYRKINRENNIFYGNFDNYKNYGNEIELNNLQLENLISGTYYFNNNLDYNTNKYDYDYYELVFNRNQGKLKKVVYSDNENYIIYYKKNN
jgi:hypothetical protein